jgi:branched-subunit amino acid transport protein AzlD
MNAITRLIPALVCFLFIALGCILIPYAGIQNDEALFSEPLFLHINRELRARMFHTDIPLMVMSYVGSLKTLVYWPIFSWLGANVWTTRLPMVLAGAATIFIFYRLARRAAGPRAALVSLLLLATDPVFLMTNTFDWGPVAIEHLLLVTGCFFLVRFAQESVTRTASLFAGFFCLGLALWNKAIFLWALAGLTVGVGVVFWREVRDLLRWKRAAIGVAAFALGALPFLIYNTRHPNATLKSSAVISTAEFSGKFLQLRRTLGGEALFGYIAGEDFLDRPKHLTTPLGRATGWIRNHLGEHRTGWMLYACGALLLAVPLWWRSRAARFSVVFCAVAWAAMALTRDAGGSAHHAILLWPFPQLFVACALAAIPWRPPWKWMACVGSTALVVFNLLVVNQYILQFERNGAAGTFTDALYPLSAAIPEQPGHTIYVLDWGMLHSLALLHRGKLTLRMASDPFVTDTPSEHDRNFIDFLLKDRDAVFVAHVPEREIFPGVGQRAEDAFRAAGFRRELLGSYPDSNGRPVFEVFRLAP